MDNTEQAVRIVSYILDHWVSVLIGVIVSLVSIAIIILLVEWRKKHISPDTEKKVVGWLIQKAILGFAALFTALDYFVPWLQQNLPVVQNIKWVGPYFVSLAAGANAIYAWKGKKVIEAWITRQEAKKTTTSNGVQTVQPQQPEQQPAHAPDSPFEATN